jgi:hypothetical protein
MGQRFQGSRIQQILIDLDKLANGLLLGDPEHTISHRAGQAALVGNPFLSSVIDYFFGEGHCHACRDERPEFPAGAAYGLILGAAGTATAVTLASVSASSTAGLATGLAVVGCGSMAAGIGLVITVPLLAAASGSWLYNVERDYWDNISLSSEFTGRMCEEILLRYGSQESLRRHRRYFDPWDAQPAGTEDVFARRYTRPTPP